MSVAKLFRLNHWIYFDIIRNKHVFWVNKLLHSREVTLKHFESQLLLILTKIPKDMFIRCYKNTVSKILITFVSTVGPIVLFDLIKGLLTVTYKYTYPLIYSLCKLFSLASKYFGLILPNVHQTCIFTLHIYTWEIILLNDSYFGQTISKIVSLIDLQMNSFNNFNFYNMMCQKKVLQFLYG